MTNTLARIRALERNSNLYGRAFEQFIAMELRAAIGYQRSPARLAFWRTHDQYEVDFVVEDVCAVEVKATERTSDRDTASLRRLQSEKELPAYFLVSQDPVERLKDGIRFVPYGRFLELLWSGDLLKGKSS